VGVRFHLLTKGATLNVFLNVGTKTGPPKVTLNKFFGFKTTGMPHGGVVMEMLE
jgi:hypothetical protein